VTYSKSPAWIAAFVAQLLPLTAGAADAEAEARELFGRGNALYEAGRDAEAEVAYERAWLLRPSYDLAANLGLAELNQGDFVAAATHLRFALDNLPPGSPPKLRAQLQAAYAKVLDGLGWLDVHAEPADAVVTVGGAGSVTLPEGVAVEPGTHRVTGVKEGHESAWTVVTVAAGHRAEVALRLVPLPAPVPAVQVAPEVAPVRAAETPTTPRQEPRSEGPSHLPTFIGAGVGLALLGAAIGFSFAAKDAKADADAERLLLTAGGQRCVGSLVACEAFEAAVAQRDRFHSVAVGFYATAAVALGAAIVLEAGLAGVDEPAARTGFVPAVGPEALGFSWSGAF
jgi:tetratricopeptide (TPR) repeat protein